MIYLIGGAPRCGKSNLAKKLSKYLNISFISADTIESIVKINTNKEYLSEKFPKDKIRDKTKNSNDIMYSEYSTSEIKNAYIKQAKVSWESIKKLISIELMKNNDYIIEGHQIHPEFIKQIKNDYNKKKFKSIFLLRDNVDLIVKNCTEYPSKNDWFIDKTKKQETYYKIAKMIKKYSIFFNKEAKKQKIKTINTDKKFKTKLKQAHSHLTS